MQEARAPLKHGEAPHAAVLLSVRAACTSRMLPLWTTPVPMLQDVHDDTEDLHKLESLFYHKEAGPIYESVIKGFYHTMLQKTWFHMFEPVVEDIKVRSFGLRFDTYRFRFDLNIMTLDKNRYDDHFYDAYELDEKHLPIELHIIKLSADCWDDERKVPTGPGQVRALLYIHDHVPFCVQKTYGRELADRYSPEKFIRENACKARLLLDEHKARQERSLEPPQQGSSSNGARPQEDMLSMVTARQEEWVEVAAQEQHITHQADALDAEYEHMTRTPQHLQSLAATVHAPPLLPQEQASLERLRHLLREVQQEVDKVGPDAAGASSSWCKRGALSSSSCHQ